MASDDDERTVFGRQLPTGSGSKSAEPDAPSEQEERTIFGVNLPGKANEQAKQQPTAANVPPHQQSGGRQQIGGNPQNEDTWFGFGRSSQQQPAQPQYPSSPPLVQSPDAPSGAHDVGNYTPPPQHSPNFGHQPNSSIQPAWVPQGAPTNNQFPGGVPAPEPVISDQPKIAFESALMGSGLEIGASSNPVIAAASDLLVLLGRLRTGIVEMQAIPLRDHVFREIGKFVQTAQEQGVSAEDVAVARYALAATADDIVQNIPGRDQAYWQQYPMSAELLNDRSAGVGFFARLDEVMSLLQQRQAVAELMLTCLFLGFEGKFRSEANGSVNLMRLRNEVYQRLRSVSRRPGTDISVNWTPVLLGRRLNMSRLPFWFIGSVAACMIVALFATLSGILASKANASQEDLLALLGSNNEVAIESPNGLESTPYIAPAPEQLERIRAALSDEISKDLLSVDLKGEYIAVRVASQLLFNSGSADLVANFSGLAERIGDTLQNEPGSIVIEGHSDNIPLSGRGRFKSNEALSEARAETVRTILSRSISDNSRMKILGIGPNDPIDSSNTPEARRKNRRVEILLERQY